MARPLLYPPPANTSPEENRMESQIDWIGAERTVTHQRGVWRPAPLVEVRSRCGLAVVDLRQAQFADGVTTFEVDALAGGVDFIVPPGLQIASDGQSTGGIFAFRPETPQTQVCVEGKVSLGMVRIAERSVSAVSDAEELPPVRNVAGVTRRDGRWEPGSLVRVENAMGLTVLDFSEAELEPGMTEVHVMIWAGGVRVVVPPTLATVIEGSAFMGDFTCDDDVITTAPPAGPWLRIGGFAVMGGVNVVTSGQSSGSGAC